MSSVTAIPTDCLLQEQKGALSAVECLFLGACSQNTDNAAPCFACPHLQSCARLCRHFVLAVNVPHLCCGSICGWLGALANSSPQAPGCGCHPLGGAHSSELCRDAVSKLLLDLQKPCFSYLLLWATGMTS